MHNRISSAWATVASILVFNSVIYIGFVLLLLGVHDI